MGYLVEVSDLSKHFGGLAAVDHLEFGVTEGEILGLIGPNGAGKSTVINLINGFLAPDGGRVGFDGKDITGWSPSQRARSGMGRVFQLDVLFESLNVSQSIEVGSHLWRRSGGWWLTLTPSSRRLQESALERHVGEVLEVVGLTDDARMPVTTLPHGKKRLLALGIALASKPRLVLLDEPLTGMNAGETARMIDVIKTLNVVERITFLIVEHNMEAVMNLCSSLCVINFGEKIAFGTPAAVANDPLVIDAYLGSDDGDDVGMDGEDSLEPQG